MTIESRAGDVHLAAADAEEDAGVASEAERPVSEREVPNVGKGRDGAEEGEPPALNLELFDGRSDRLEKFS
jgi:hypothetical protein